MKQFFYGGLTTLAGVSVIAVLVGLAIVKAGLVPINADQTPSGLERKLLPTVVRASVARGATGQGAGLVAPSDDDLAAGMEIYKEMCAQCHGQLSGRPSVMGASFYPPAPQLPGQGTAYNEAEVFWIVKHGIRNTSMPAWRNLLSDENIQQVTAFITRIDSWQLKRLTSEK